METIILGIDPGSRCTGFGVIKNQPHQYQHIASGVIRPPTRESMSDRLHYIHQHIVSLIKDYKPQHMAIEKVFVSKNPAAALKLGQSRSCALIAAASTKLSVFEYSPRQIKQAVTGHGAAIKQQVQHMVTQLLKLTHQPTEDAADALALALCHACIYTFSQKIKGAS